MNLDFEAKVMTSFISKGHLDFLSDKQKAELSKHIQASATAMPHQLAVRLGIEYPKALAILTLLEAEGLCELQLLIYHNCEPDIPKGAIPFGKGFPDLPWVCPSCESRVEDYNELSFDIMAHFTQKVKFI
jgi:rubredoxin